MSSAISSRLSRQLREADRILQQLDAEIEGIEFDPRTPGGLELAALETSAVIDRLLANFRGHPVLAPLTTKLKSQYLERLQDRHATPPKWTQIPSLEQSHCNPGQSGTSQVANSLDQHA